MSGMATTYQYIDKEDVVKPKRWVARLCYGNEEVRTYHLESREAAMTECCKWAKRLGWLTDDNGF